jgi:hypothetical protein
VLTDVWTEQVDSTSVECLLPDTPPAVGCAAIPAEYVCCMSANK